MLHQSCKRNVIAKKKSRNLPPLYKQWRVERVEQKKKKRAEARSNFVAFETRLPIFFSISLLKKGLKSVVQNRIDRADFQAAEHKYFVCKLHQWIPTTRYTYQIFTIQPI